MIQTSKRPAEAGRSRQAPFHPLRLRVAQLLTPPSQQYSMPDMDGNYSSDASPNKGRSKSQPRMRGEKSSSPSRKQDLLKIVPPKLISNDELEERKSQRVARDLRESTKIFAHANEQRNSIRCEESATALLHAVLTTSHPRQSLETDVDRRIVQRYLSRKEMLVAWGRKLERSPFLVDQVAESERIDEEHRVKLLEEARRMQRFDARKKVIKKEIILRVLAESNAIETLRSEKR